MATVLIFSYSEVLPAKVGSGAGQAPADSLLLLKEPYSAREKLEPTTSAQATSIAATAPADTKMLKVQILGGLRCHYEVTPASQTPRVADTESPILNGDDIIFFGQGYLLSVLEVTE